MTPPPYVVQKHCPFAGAERAPKNLHTHGHDNCDLTTEITIGDFDGGYFGRGEVKTRAWALWGERLVLGCLVLRCLDARAGVLFNAYHSHGPTCWRGERYAIVCYTCASWAHLTPAVRQGLLEMGFNCGDDM